MNKTSSWSSRNSQPRWDSECKPIMKIQCAMYHGNDKHWKLCEKLAETKSAEKD